jgi:hypothetical protein
VKGLDGDVLYFRPAFVCRAAKIVRLDKEKTKRAADNARMKTERRQENYGQEDCPKVGVARQAITG